MFPAFRRGACAFFLGAALLAGDAAQAWGPAGHEAIGAVADQRLSPAARAVIQRLLAEDLDRDGHPSHRTTLAQVASWPDEIRGHPGDHPHWHYDNIPVCHADGGTAAWCRQGECASVQVDRQLAILANANLPLQERNEALKWVVHLVGDLHQPLHAADFAEGANLIHVLPHGGHRHREGGWGESTAFHGGEGHHEGESLHAFWDSRLVHIDLHDEHGVIPERSLRRLFQVADHFSRAELDKGPGDWALESNQIARDFALRIDGIQCALEGRHDLPEVMLPDAYVARARHIVDERLALAGARLAQQLNRALAAGR